jgi:hypothetical protein
VREFIRSCFLLAASAAAATAAAAVTICSNSKKGPEPCLAVIHKIILTHELMDLWLLPRYMVLDIAANFSPELFVKRWKTFCTRLVISSS